VRGGVAAVSHADLQELSERIDVLTEKVESLRRFL
jgi:hypothetical protein